MRGGPASALRDVLDRAGVKAGAVAVRFSGLDEPVVDGAPEFMKSLDIDHARDGEVMLAYQMNGEQLPLLNGFPLRLIVPGWYSTYWVKMLSDIEVLDAPDDNYLDEDRLSHSGHAAREREAGRNGLQDRADQPDGAALLLHQCHQCARPSSRSAPLPVQRDRVRRRLRRRRRWNCRSTADEAGRQAALGRDEGAYGFRQWSAQITAPPSGTLTLQVRCTNTKGEVQPTEPNWNGGGFMRNVIERVQLTVA